MKSKKLYKLHYLSNKFYNKYNSVEYPEIEYKTQRPYIVLLIKIDNNIFGLPLRTNIRHSSCYKFQYSTRPTNSITGIDFSKAVVVNDAEYIGKAAEMDNKEYVELNDRIAFIISKFRTYIKGYYSFVSGNSNDYQAKKYKYTTLKYFHKELGIEAICNSNTQNIKPSLDDIINAVKTDSKELNHKNNNKNNNREMNL